MSTAGLVWANLQRRPVRTYLTLFSVLVAFLLFTLLRTLAAFFEGGGVDLTGADRMVVSAKYSIIEDLPLSQRSQMLAVEGVEAVTHQSWFGGNYQDPSNFFPKFPVEPRAYFDMYPEMVISPEHLEAFQNTRTGAVASASMLEKFGWEVGDKIPIEADIWPMRDGNRLWEFDLVGYYTWGEEESGQETFLFHFDFFDEARQFGQGNVGWWTVRIGDPDRAPEIANAIDALFENSLDPTKSATEDEFQRSFAAQIGDIGMIANGILSAVFFTILLLTAVVMNQALRERIPELAVLKTLGFSNAKVATMVLAESVLLCTLGGVLGIVLATAVSQVEQLNAMLSGFGASVTPTVQTVLAAIGISVALGAVVGLHPALKANRLTIADALRRA